MLWVNADRINYPQISLFSGLPLGGRVEIHRTTVELLHLQLDIVGGSVG